ncbi:MAG: hypothetical protein EYC62_08390 [Alphaproteobacteria bacterium]|nr:MAG: hypothetical protein EYC62_08390 [Alphaproteobacteria bacterium]
MTKGLGEILHVVYVGQFPVQQAIVGHAVNALQGEGADLELHCVRSSLGLRGLKFTPDMVVVDNANITTVDQDWGTIRAETRGEMGPVPVILFADVKTKVNPQLGGPNTTVLEHVNNGESLTTALLVHVMGGRVARV